MLKNILKAANVQELSKNEQKSINGGITRECSNAWNFMVCTPKGSTPCPSGTTNFCGRCCSID